MNPENAENASRGQLIHSDTSALTTAWACVHVLFDTVRCNKNKVSLIKESFCCSAEINLSAECVKHTAFTCIQTRLTKPAGCSNHIYLNNHPFKLVACALIQLKKIMNYFQNWIKPHWSVAYDSSNLEQTVTPTQETETVIDKEGYWTKLCSRDIIKVKTTL